MKIHATQNPLVAAIDEIGAKAIAEAVGVSHQAVYKWRHAGRLPRTEWTGETDYRKAIVRLGKGRWTRAQLLRSGERRSPIGWADIHPPVTGDNSSH